MTIGKMRILLSFATVLFAVTLAAQSASDFGPLPDGLQFPVASTAELNSATVNVGQTLKFRMLNNLRGPGGVVALPKDADLFGRVDLVRAQEAGSVRLRLTVYRAEWPGGSMNLHAFITFVQSGGTKSAKELHAEFASEPEVGVDLVSAGPIIIAKNVTVTLRQTTQAGTLPTQSTEAITPGTTIRAALKSFIDVKKCKQGDVVKLESLGELRRPGGEAIIPDRADLLGTIIECGARKGVDGEAIFSALVDLAKWNKGSIPLHMAVEIGGARSQAAGGRSFSTVVRIERGSVEVPNIYRNSTLGQSVADNPFEEVQFRQSTSPGQPGIMFSKTRDFRFEPGTVFILRQLPAKQ